MPRVLTQEERRQENVIFMRSLPRNPNAAEADTEIDTGTESETETGEIFGLG
jgi:hypothetical protein